MNYLLLFALLLTQFALAEPTEVREWRSTAGTTISASAIEITENQVVLKTENGRQINVPLNKFIEEDQETLRDHFAVKTPESGQPKESGVPFIKDGLAFPIGQTSGPIKASNDSTYFVYIPTTLRKDRKPPLMFWTGPAGGNMHSAKRLQAGAELNGWIIATSVESRNGNERWQINHNHSKECVEHLISQLPIDPARVYFTGGSGGGAMSFYNANRIKSAGNMPVIGYTPDKSTYERHHYSLGLGGTTDYNRYLTAHAVSKYKDRGLHRFYVGGHTGAPEQIENDGIAWLNGRYLGDRRNEPELDAERLDYEASMIAWIRKLTTSKPHQAYYWCDFLQKDYNIDGSSAAVLEEITKELARDQKNVRYSEGIAALDEFSEKYFAPEGEGSGSKFGHTSGKIQRAAEKLAQEYAGVPEIEAIARDLAKPSVSRGK